MMDDYESFLCHSGARAANSGALIPTPIMLQIREFLKIAVYTFT